MKLRNRGLVWALVLLFTGLFLLLKNLEVFGPWGDAAWGGLFAAIGLGFLIWFIIDPKEWWRAIPGFILASTGGLVLLDWRGVNLGDWRGALVLFGIALGFWTVALVRAENWWSLIPAGVTTILGLLVGLQRSLGPAGSPAWLAVLFCGLGAVFALMYVLRPGQPHTRWAAIPAAALILLGITTVAGTAGNLQTIARWWPILLLVGGLGLLVGSLQRRPTVEPTVIPDFDAIPAAKGTSVTERLPEVKVPLLPKTEPARAEQQVDIYEFLRNQPAEAPPGEQPGEPLARDNNAANDKTPET